MFKSYAKDRKFKLVLIGILFIFAGYLATIAFPVLAGLYTTYVGALMGMAGLYFGANVLQKKVEIPATKIKESEFCED